MKPRDKVVSAQDVESSLYYCHLDCEEDEAVRASLQSGDEIKSLLDAKRHSMQMPQENITPAKRKSLPRTPQPEGTRPEPPPKVYPHFQRPSSALPGTLRVERKPVGRAPSHSDKLANNKVLSDRHFGDARPGNSTIYAQSSESTRGKENTKPHALPGIPPELPPRANSASSTYGGDFIVQTPKLPARPAELGGSQLPRSSNSSLPFLPNQPSTHFSITIIRRDPSSGGQWNVGKISKENALAQTYGGSEVPSANDVDMEIYTAGYDKFARQNGEEYGHRLTYKPFQRSLQTQKRNPNQSAARKSLFRSSVDRPRRSSDQIPQELLKPPNVAASDDLPTLCFLSPWNGICEFSTGASGRTLKCRHSPPARGNQVDPLLRRLGSSAISELRLNLPVVKSSGPKRPPLSASHSRTSFYSSHSGHRHSVSADSSSTFVSDDRDAWEDAEEERMDLSLGQERAGGGFGGKKAKLGKLIVEGEGLLMLDLVVAANMGFWWNLRSRRQ